MASARNLLVRQRGNDAGTSPWAAGLATALQLNEDRMGDRLASLTMEQSVLLAKLEAARQSLPMSAEERLRRGAFMDDDLEYVSRVMGQVPTYVHRVKALTAKKASLEHRLVDLQRRSAELRETLPPPLPQQTAAELLTSRAELQSFREERNMAYVVCYRGGVAIRTSPHVDAPCAGEVLEWEETFWASERFGRLGDQMVYVRLMDGRGWVFEHLNGTRVLQRFAADTSTSYSTAKYHPTT